MKKYIKKPVPVLAFRWDGNPETLKQNLTKQEIQDDFKVSTSWLLVSTPQGVQICSVGDYVIKSPNGKFHPCNAKVFKESYKEIK